MKLRHRSKLSFQISNLWRHRCMRSIHNCLLWTESLYRWRHNNQFWTVSHNRWRHSSAFIYLFHYLFKLFYYVNHIPSAITMIFVLPGIINTVISCCIKAWNFLRCISSAVRTSSTVFAIISHAHIFLS